MTPPSVPLGSLKEGPTQKLVGSTHPRKLQTKLKTEKKANKDSSLRISNHLLFLEVPSVLREAWTQVKTDLSAQRT